MTLKLLQFICNFHFFLTITMSHLHNKSSLLTQKDKKYSKVAGSLPV